MSNKQKAISNKHSQQKNSFLRFTFYILLQPEAA